MRRRYYSRRWSPSGRAIGIMAVLAAVLAYVASHLPASKVATVLQPKSQTGAVTEQIAGGARIVDGDTVKIGTVRVRLSGIDAPEHRQFCRKPNGEKWPCGQAATDALQAKIGGHPITCSPRDTDRYGRTVAVCYLDGVDLNAWMVENGWAVAYRQFSGDYVGAEEKASAAHVGIWSGSFQNPADWRREHRHG